MKGSEGALREIATDDAVVERIVAAVMEHELPPGAKLPENALCEAFNVSRTQIRRILVVLGERGVVTLHPNRGAFVWSPTADDAREVFAARRAVETATVRGAAAAATQSAIARLRAVAAAGHAASRTSQREAIRYSGLFHVEIAEIAGNSLLTRFLGDLVARTSLIIAFYGTRMQQRCSDSEHDDLIDALAARDGERASALMEGHLRHIEAELVVREVVERPFDIRRVFGS